MSVETSLTVIAAAAVLFVAVAGYVALEIRTWRLRYLEALERLWFKNGGA